MDIKKDAIENFNTKKQHISTNLDTIDQSENESKVLEVSIECENRGEYRKTDTM